MSPACKSSVHTASRGYRRIVLRQGLDELREKDEVRGEEDVVLVLVRQIRLGIDALS